MLRFQKFIENGTPWSNSVPVFRCGGRFKFTLLLTSRSEEVLSNILIFLPVHIPAKCYYVLSHDADQICWNYCQVLFCKIGESWTFNPIFGGDDEFIEERGHVPLLHIRLKFVAVTPLRKWAFLYHQGKVAILVLPSERESLIYRRKSKIPAHTFYSRWKIVAVIPS